MAPGDNLPSDSPATLSLVDGAAFARFYERTHLAVFRYIYTLAGGPPALVEDLTAETYYKAWRARSSFTGNDGAGLGWLLRIARNLVIDLYRKRSRQGQAGALDEESFAGSGPGPEALLELADEQQRLLEALQRLPERPRTLLALRYVLGWKVKDIACHMEMAENTVSVALRRALERLRREWRGRARSPGSALPCENRGKGPHEAGAAGPDLASLRYRASQNRGPGG